MAKITDEMMGEWLTAAAGYCLVILRKADGPAVPGRDKIVWEHGRRNMSLQADGLLPIVCPVRDDSDIAGAGIFAASVDETRRIMDGDPGVQAGVFSYEVHATRSRPGSALPPR